MQEREQQREVPYRSEIEDFVRTSAWKYIAEEVATLMLQATADNDELDPYKDAAQLCRNQGLIRFGKIVLDMPAQMAEEADELAEQRTRQRQEEEVKDGTD